MLKFIDTSMEKSMNMKNIVWKVISLEGNIDEHGKYFNENHQA